MLFWSHLLLYQNQEQLKHYLLPCCHNSSCLEVTISLLSIYRVPKHAAVRGPHMLQLQSSVGAILGAEQRIFFTWLASGLRTHWSCSLLGREMCIVIPSCMPTPPPWAHTTHQGMQTRPPDCIVCFLCSKPLSRIPEGDVRCGRCRQLYTTSNIQGLPPISLPPPAVKASAMLMYAVRSPSK